MPLEIVTALVAGGTALVVGVISAVATIVVANRRAGVDEKLAQLKGVIDKELAEQKDRLDNKTVFAAERVARDLMMDSKLQWRSFRIIKHHLGGFEDQELRKILVRAGAIRVLSSSGDELWGLADRNKAYIGVERLESDPVRVAGWAPDGSQIIADNFDPGKIGGSNVPGGLIQG